MTKIDVEEESLEPDYFIGGTISGRYSTLVVNFYMLCTCMKYRVAGDVNTTLIVTMDDGWSLLIEIDVEEESPEPDYFSGGTTNGTILCLS